MLIGGGFYANILKVDLQRLGNGQLHVVDVGIDFGRLGDYRGVHVDVPSAAKLDEPGCFLQKNTARRAAPAGIGVRKKMADVCFAQRAKEGVADGVHERIGVGVAVEAFGVRDFDAAQNEFAAFNQRVNVVTNANVNHVTSLKTQVKSLKSKVLGHGGWGESSTLPPEGA